MPTPTKGRRLGGGPSHERLMLANLATALFEHGRITTTEAKAKRLRPLAERLERASTATGTYPTTLPGNMTWTTDAGKRYTIALNPATTSTFTLTAAPKAGTAQVGDKCGNLSVTNTGVRDASPLTSGATVEECWRR